MSKLGKKIHRKYRNFLRKWNSEYEPASFKAWCDADPVSQGWKEHK